MPSSRAKVMTLRNWSGFILAGATLRDRVWACCGALAGVGITALVCTAFFPHDTYLPFLVAPIGASAVLVFAVPASPLAQPWPVIGGNTISALMGIATSHVVHNPMIAVGLSVALAIAAMSLARCLHPPGGAAALTAVLGSHTTAITAWSFALAPVALNSVLLVFGGWVFHKFTRHAYPHHDHTITSAALPDHNPLIGMHNEFQAEDLDAALRDFGEPLDIRTNDLGRLLHLVQIHAQARQGRDRLPAGVPASDAQSTGGGKDIPG